MTHIGLPDRIRRLSGQSMFNDRAPRWFQRSPCMSLVVALWLVVGVPCLRSEQSKAGEFEVKAAYLYNFARFVEWPGETSTDGKGLF